MGKVFTPEEIQAGKVPVEGAHLAAADIIVDQLLRKEVFPYLFQKIGYIGIESGLVHGSVTHGTETIRSDLDVLLIHRPGGDRRSEGLDTVRDIFGSIETNLHVPVESHIVTLTDALSRNHRIDPLFLRYLASAQENPKYSYGFPVSSLWLGFTEHSFSRQNLARVAQRYTGGKTASFASALAEGATADMHRYQRALELPKNLGRKIVSMLDKDIDGDFKPVLDGPSVLAGFKDFIAQTSNSNEQSLINAIDKLDSIDREYSEVLTDAVDHRVNLASYQAWLDAHALPAFELAHEICVDTQATLDVYAKSLRPKPEKHEQAKDMQLTFEIEDTDSMDDLDSDY